MSGPGPGPELKLAGDGYFDVPPWEPEAAADRHQNLPELVDRLVQAALVLKCAAQLAEPLYREADCRLTAAMEIRHEQMLTQCRTVRRLIDDVGGILDARYQAGDPNRRHDPAPASLHLAGD